MRVHENRIPRSKIRKLLVIVAAMKSAAWPYRANETNVVCSCTYVEVDDSILSGSDLSSADSSVDDHLLIIMEWTINLQRASDALTTVLRYVHHNHACCLSLQYHLIHSPTTTHNFIVVRVVDATLPYENRVVVCVVWQSKRTEKLKKCTPGWTLITKKSNTWYNLFTRNSNLSRKPLNWKHALLHLAQHTFV